MWRRKPKPERKVVTARLNDSEFESLKADVIARHNQTGGSISSLKSQLRALEMGREEPAGEGESGSPD
jgi:hypothetical protein